MWIYDKIIMICNINKWNGNFFTDWSLSIDKKKMKKIWYKKDR